MGLTAINVPGRNVIVRMVMERIEELSCAILKAMCTFVTLSCCATRFRSYET